jgi:hypothetical protein
VTSLGRPLGRDREHTHPSRLQTDSAANQRFNGRTLWPRSLSDDPEGSPVPWASLLS